ncbi:unnamed protein product [Urochloa humidicola]
MRDVAGSAGSWSGLALRASQCVCAAASFAAMVSVVDHGFFTAFRALCISMELQFIWSFFLLCADIHWLRTKRDPDEYSVHMVAFFDWLISTLSMATASASAAVVIYLERDSAFCTMYPQLSCSRYKLSVMLAFMAWSFVAASSASSFWLLPSIHV